MLDSYDVTSISTQIRDDVYWTDHNGQVIVADMITGKYFALEAIGAHVWQLLAERRTNAIQLTFDSPERHACIARSSAERAALEALRAKGLLMFRGEEAAGVHSDKRGTKKKVSFLWRGRKKFQPEAQVGSIKRIFLLAEAYCILLLIDLRLSRVGFHGLFRELSRHSGSASITTADQDYVDTLCHLALSAYRWYRPRVACMHRAVCLYIFLQRRGIRAELCLGVQARPFGSHAWAEYKGRVLGESKSGVGMFKVIARLV